MSCGTECSISEVASFSKEIAGEFHKVSRISYSINYLLSLADVNVTHELPAGFDRSILSELDDACKGELEHQKLPGPESSERRSTFKLPSKDSKSLDSGNAYNIQSRSSWQKPGNTVILRSLPNPEHDGILGSWSASKLPSGGSEVNLQGTNSCLLSRCKEPYRPPSFYKATLLSSGTQNHETSSNKASGCAECPSKERAMGEKWRKDDADICIVSEECSAVSAITSKKSPLPVSPTLSGTVESSCSAGEASEECDTEGFPDHQPLLKDPLVQSLPSKSQSIEVDSGVAPDVEKFQGKVLEGGRFSALINLEEAEDIDAYFLDEENLAPNDNARNGQSVKEANMGYKASKKNELGSHVDYSAKCKETKIADILHVDATGKTASNSSAVDISTNSANFVRPSHRASSLQSASVNQDSNSADATAKEMHKANAPLRFDSDHSKVRPQIANGFTQEIWQSSHGTKNHGNIIEDRRSCSSDSRFKHRFTDKEKYDCDISCVVADKDGRKGSAGKSMMENLVGLGKPNGLSTHAQKAPFSKKTKNGAADFFSSHFDVLNTLYSDGISQHSLNVQEPELDKTSRNRDLHRASEEVCGFQNADSSLELNLPDEDSLITIDDTYILNQDKPKPSPEFSFGGARSIPPFAGFNRLIGSETITPDPWNNESRINSWNLSDNPSGAAHINAPSTFYDPMKIHHNVCNPFAVVPSHPRQLPLKSQNFGPPVENSFSPPTPHADDYCPDLDKILSAEPSIYHQFLQTPYCNQEQNTLISVPLNHQAYEKSTLAKGTRGFLAEERYTPTVSQYLQMRRKLALTNLEAQEKRAYGKAASNIFW